MKRIISFIKSITEEDVMVALDMMDPEERTQKAAVEEHQIPWDGSRPPGFSFCSGTVETMLPDRAPLTLVLNPFDPNDSEHLESLEHATKPSGRMLPFQTQTIIDRMARKGIEISPGEAFASFARHIAAMDRSTLEL